MTPSKSNIARIKRAGDTYAINCYGAVAFALGKTPEPRWLKPWELDCLVLEGCQALRASHDGDKTPDLEPGDIMVMLAAEYPSTVHAAVYVGPGDRWFHKPGHTPAEFATLEDVLGCYDHMAYVFGRPKTEKTLAELKEAA